MGWTNNWNDAQRQQAIPSAIGEELMDARQTAMFLKISRPCLYNWIRAGKMIDGVVIGGKRRWSRTIVANYVYGKFVEQQQQLSGAGAK